MIIPAVMKIHEYRRFHGPGVGTTGRWRLQWTAESADQWGYLGENWTAAVSTAPVSGDSGKTIADLGPGRITCLRRPDVDAEGNGILFGTTIVVDGPMDLREGRTRPRWAPGTGDALITATVVRARLVSITYDFNDPSGEPVTFQGRIGRWHGLGPVRDSTTVVESAEPPATLRHGATEADREVMWQEVLLLSLDAHD